MAYETAEGPLNERYEVGFRHPAINGSEPMVLNITHNRGNESSADADVIFQKLVDLIDGSADFALTSPATKHYEHQQSITPTSP